MRLLVHRTLSAIGIFWAMSIIAFSVIQFPPGDYVSTYVARLEAMGERLDPESVESLRKVSGLDKPMVERYFQWISRFLIGDWGYSFQSSRPVREMIFERLPLTISIEALTVFFVLLVAIPLGAYSAVRQYSVGDYAATGFSFLGLATPNFIIALVIMWLAYKFFGVIIAGVNSDPYIGEPWSLAKLIDSARHLWVSVFVNASAAIAGYVRILRANLLDELNQPYVTMARAMGMTETRLHLKYTLRMASNPLISNMGSLLPQLISSSTITAIVLSIPTTAPMLYEALLAQDIYLAGGVIMCTGVLIIVGTMLSDLFLYFLDPRIRFSATY